MTIIRAAIFDLAPFCSRHGALCIRYLTSALLHGLLGACHLMHFG
jgi:hypothetical protein